jgi:serine/threonine protein phosphatase PrpC
LGAFITGGNRLTVFSIGDSMAVLSSQGKAIVISDAHKPDRLDEQQRIKRANGWITEEKELYLSRLHQMDYSDPLALDRAKNMNWVTIYRVCGELAVSRSIGDPDYKGFVPGEKVDAYFGWPDGHKPVSLFIYAVGICFVVFTTKCVSILEISHFNSKGVLCGFGHS